MVSTRMVKRVSIAGLIICLVYILLLMAGPIQNKCKCDEPEKPIKSVPVEIEAKPKDPGHFLCLIVPYRERFEELTEFVPQMTAFLRRKQIPHYIFVINQVDSYRFNRASLLNAGFLLSELESIDSSASGNCDYIALHDVDLIPVNDQLPYTYPSKGLLHVSAPGLHPKYDYPTFIGGILIITRQLFRKVDGLSNHYWGWGLEDDEFYARLHEANISVERPVNVTSGRKDTFKHYHPARSRPRDMARCYNQYEVTRKRDRETGLHSVKYSVVKHILMSIDTISFTMFNVALFCDASQTPWCNCHDAPKTDSRQTFKRDKDVILPILNKKPKKRKIPALP